MIIFGIIFLILSGIAAVLGRQEDGPIRYRGVRWMMKRAERRGWYLPEWMNVDILLRTWILLLLGSVLMTVLGTVNILSDEKITGLMRPEYGEGSKQEELEIEWKDTEGNKGKNKVIVDVEERKLTKEEMEKIFHEIREKLGEVSLGDNKTADRVDQPLVLAEKLEGYPAVISWVSSDPTIVDWEGNLGKDIPEEGKLVCLTASIRLQEEERTYDQYVKVFPPVLDDQEQLNHLVREENQSPESGWMELPKLWGDRKLVWKRSTESTAAGIVILLLLVPFFLLIRDRENVEEKRRQERQQMMQDYPEILSKLTLLLSAGVNLRMAMERIAKDYVNYNRKRGKRKAYEVIVEVCGEMQRGVAEKEAYERIGERCGLLPYRTFSALLVQHLQKGSRGMERVLEEEAVKAQELRQQQARILGEQASTKLLFPMLLMLLVVFVILLVPAWISFAG